MTNPKVNLLNEVSPNHPQGNDTGGKHPRRRRRFFITAMVFFLVVSALVVANVVLPGIKLSASLGSSGLLTQLRHLTFGGDRTVHGEEEDRVNVLLMGIGGEGHDGPLLTDTIMVASIQPSTGKASLVSLPRDLLVQLPNGHFRKINEAYHTGEQVQPGRGGEYAAQTIGDVLGVSLPYYVIVDFQGFEKIINEIGGVNVNVERTFSDPLFPTDDDRTKSVTFSAGWQHMNGEQALTFARSRHGNNGEGSDFARARRQQKIILATKDKLFSSRVLLNTVTVNRLADQLADNITTNVEPWELWRLYNLGKDVNPENVVRLTPDNSPGGLLVDATGIDGAYLLQPRGGSFDELRQTVRNIFVDGDRIQEPPRVEIQNGTTISGLGARVSNALERQGYRVVAVTNATDRAAKETVIYDYTSGGKPASLAALRLIFDARVATGIPAWLLPSASTLDPNASNYRAPSAPQSKADFLVIVGANAANDFPN